VPYDVENRAVEKGLKGAFPCLSPWKRWTGMDAYLMREEKNICENIAHHERRNCDEEGKHAVQGMGDVSFLLVVVEKANLRKRRV